MYVYCITNNINGKIYVGQHVGDDLQAYLEYNLRMALRLSALRHKPILYRAMQKYGPDAFVIKSLVSPIDKNQMDKLETFFIRTFETQNPEIGYNISPGGGMGGLFTPEHCKALSEGNRGTKRFRSAEHSQKIRENKLNEWALKKERGIVPQKRVRTTESLKKHYESISEYERSTMKAVRKAWWASEDGLRERQKRSAKMKGNSCLKPR